MISHAHRCVFIHIPKTAGNSINRVFGVAWQDHKDLQRYRDELGAALLEEYFKFAIVRNPWDRLLSDYNYQRKKSRPAASKLFLFGDDGSPRDFAAWVDAALAQPGAYAPSAWGGDVSPHIHRLSPQIEWIAIDGKPQVDFVARLERLAEDFRVIAQRLALPTHRLPHRNRRRHFHYSHYYDRETRERVAAYYARDIELFGYEYESASLRLFVSWLGHAAEDARANARAHFAGADFRRPATSASGRWLAGACGGALAASLLVVLALVGGLSGWANLVLRSAVHRTLAPNARRVHRDADPFARLLTRGASFDDEAKFLVLPGGAAGFTFVVLPDAAPAPASGGLAAAHVTPPPLRNRVRAWLNAGAD